LQTLEAAYRRAIFYYLQLAISYWQQASLKPLTASRKRYFAEK